MSVLVGSHQLGSIKEVKNIKRSKKSINTFKPQNIVSIKKRFKEKFINLHLGDICLFNENIIHKSNKNFTNTVRFVPIVRLQPKKVNKFYVNKYFLIFFINILPIIIASRLVFFRMFMASTSLLIIGYP